MTKRDSFLRSVSREHLADFLGFIRQHADRTDPFDLEEVLQEMHGDQRRALWENLSALLAESLLAYPVERWDGGMAGDSEDEVEVEVSPDLKSTMSVIDGVTAVASASVAVIQEDDAYSALLECTNILNGIRAALPPSEAPLQLAVGRLCEVWWRAGLEGREPLGHSAFLQCLERTLVLKNPGPEIQRLWSLHAVLQGVPFEAEHSQELTDPLLQCFMSVAHIRREEGRRFLTFLFGWDAGFIRMIHGTIKNQLQFFPKSITDDVADMYFRAWKAASGIVLEEIETTCIQDFMQHAVLLRRSSPVHAKVRQILGYFHKQKLRQGVDEMLSRLYKPILWRGLKATNSEVRANAALLFTEAFPIQDPGLSSEKLDEAVQKQLDMLFALLEDPHPMVRSTAVLGVCKIVAKYWEVIPPSILADFLKKLVTELAADINSADVRCSVFKCMTLILDNNLSHPLLEQLLPALKNGLHDNSEKVRVAFVDMLLKIKAVKAAKFWKVCSMEHLLARLEVDSRPVSRRIAGLLFNSFVPVDLPEVVWCERCVTLIQMNPVAARKFYQFAHMYTAPTNIAKLMLMIRRCLNACIQRGEGDDMNETAASNKENCTVLEDVLSSQDTATMASLLEVVVILWRSIRKSLELNQEAAQYTTCKFAQVLPEYFRVFQDERCTAPLILIASFMPAAAVPTFSCGVLSKLRRLELGAQESQYGALIDCLCSWGQAGHVTELIADWLTEALPRKTNKQGSERRVRIQEAVDTKPDLGLDFLVYLMSSRSRQAHLLGIQQNHLRQLLKSLWAWKSELYASLGLTEAEPGLSRVETALRAFSVHGRLSALLQNKFPEGRPYLEGLEHSVAWVAERVLPFLAAPSPQQQALAKQVVEACLTVCRDVTMVGLADEEFRKHLLDLCSVLLMSEGGQQCIVPLLSLLREVALECLTQSSRARSHQLDQLLGVAANIFQKVLEVMARKLRKQPDEGLQLCQETAADLGQFLCTVQDWKDVNLEAVGGVFSTVFAAVIVEVRHLLLKASCPEELVTPESIQDLPPLSACLLETILKAPKVTRSLLSETATSIELGAIEDVTGLAAVLHILAVVGHSGRFKAELKGIAVTIQHQLHKHQAVTAEDSGSTARIIYESAVKNLNAVLMV
ncbi:condensin-2 complex subunit G2 [Paramormyrops kingsleyae]|uniref:Non-SMC condensin II complex, subunit G2 n=1 Tax=Paramormyrops kingsleyae TaxID=1676925 RepID=A0A3B3RRU0_9TELE|nr:condensin-2 complex subunit G2 [Paramormyrops kingsleyae]XP_023694477.1 condensin-2 complex subunit G2 [Paramormyrops kingsleyae]